MRRLSGEPHQKVQWSDETIRLRGVRAIVAAMRLGKECRELRRENSRCLQETITCADEVNLLGALNRSLREALKGEYSKR